MTLMETVALMQKQISDLQWEVTALKAGVKLPDLPNAVPTSVPSTSGAPILYPSDSVVPRPAAELQRPELDLLEWAKNNPEEARRVTGIAIQNMLGGPAKPTPERDAAIERETAKEFAKSYSGRFYLGDIGPADWAFLARKQGPWHDRWGTDIWQSGIVAGSWRELSAMARDGETLRNNYSDADANADLVGYVMARMGG